MALMLADLPRQGFYNAFLRQNSVFLAADALFNALPVPTDFKFEMIFALRLSFFQTVQVLDFEQFRLNDVKFQVKLLRLLSRHCKSAVQFV